MNCCEGLNRGRVEVEWRCETFISDWHELVFDGFTCNCVQRKRIPSVSRKGHTKNYPF